MSTAYNPPVIRDGLVAIIDPGNPKCFSGTNLTVTSLGYNSTNQTGSLWFSSTPALYPNGAWNNITASLSGSPVNSSVSDFSVGLFFRPAVLPQTEAILFCAGEDSGGGFGGGYAFGVFSGANGASSSKLNGLLPNVSWLDFGQPDVLVVNTWYHALMTRTGGIISMYLNGIRLPNTSAQTPGTITQYMTIGTQLPVATRAFAGDIGTVHIYNRALSPYEVLQNFNALKGRFGK